MLDFFMWCTIINFGLLMFSFLLLMLAGDFIYRIHSRWFPMSRETFYTVCYSFVGLYKLAVIVLNAVPWAVLAIIG